ncbi:putative XRN 5'-3' exonuclease N-terminus [Lyophyllum shimeji]|uniref:5'-3' exoribonuclease n=1 Tax=Lyophyllum shimeji TaxID=47721 RepID=A0A9P3UHU0_LYOSH|nr:putative XRN 5'-3' exonuclease N-terminus [Lyophyllum shimeji]
MGVPALFRWLSKKYPKIIYPVEEEEEVKVPDENGSFVTIPVNMAQPNPNGTEFDNLYLDMNGIVHPCTHPEGKPAPETEDEMMLEVFKYTERVVNMIRPRRLLFMAIDGVAPRAKMNQQRSRRFRSSQEAKEKEEARKESVALWEAMGKQISDDEKNKVAWDSNAITPGTPFMSLLAASLRYWVVKKINTDPGWKNLQVIISDASVPGEGEHKIMDFIRRQRTNPGHDPNTRHVIYGLDADLIMLALATHEPHFRVLREDVFANDTSPGACRMCGQEGHYAAQCTGTKAEIQKKPPAEKKPFIFLDVSILREYLEVELHVPQASFPFSLEQAIDDWVLLIFFVGNDFLPHLPSLEIREGAIDTLLKIWKQELPRMGGYLTSHGQLELGRAQIILEGLAKREDEIFRRRREAEERQSQNAKRRKLEQQNNKAGFAGGPSPTMALTANPTPPTPSLSAAASVHPSLPQRPCYDFAANADALGFGVAPTAQSIQNADAAAQALAGSNRDVVANRRAIRMANMSAAEVLKAEMAGLAPVKPLPAKPPPSSKPVVPPIATLEASPMSSSPVAAGYKDPTLPADDDDVPGLGTYRSSSQAVLVSQVEVKSESMLSEVNDVDADGEPDPDVSTSEDVSVGVDTVVAGVKRKFEEGPAATDPLDEVVTVEEDDDDAPPDAASIAPVKVNPDGTVDQEDTVRLWEPGYKERYYRQKFGVELTDTEFRKRITQAYVEGLSWVLQYYYQGTPSWQWFYPYHFAPFAADFEDVDKMELEFVLGQPFKPFEQLMGVFPAASRKHIPSVFHSLMTDETSPIIDFYPPTFEIDMNGKKMAWQGVALLPFIDSKRLLDAMAVEYPNLTEEEVKRNQWGNDVIFASNEHPIYPFYEALYGKRKSQEPVPLDIRLSGGISGSVLRNPDCIPGSTYYCPFEMPGLPDIQNDRSLSALYFFPKQLTPHRSVILPGVKKGPRILTASDLEITRSGGGRGRGRGGWSNGGANGRSGNWAQGARAISKVPTRASEDLVAEVVDTAAAAVVAIIPLPPEALTRHRLRNNMAVMEVMGATAVALQHRRATAATGRDVVVLLLPGVGRPVTEDTEVESMAEDMEVERMADQGKVVATAAMEAMEEVISPRTAPLHIREAHEEALHTMLQVVEEEGAGNTL